MPTLAIIGGDAALKPGVHAPWPEILPEDRAAVMSVLDSGTMSGANATNIKGLQEDYRAYVGSNYCLTVNSGTAALHLALAAAGVQAGDEVIVPAYTFVATAMAVAHQGATPVFCDIDPETYHLDPAKLSDAYTERTRAVIPVHIHGQAADMDEINAFVSAHDLAVIEDAAQAHGVSYNGRRVGKLGDSAAFSLQQTKNLSAGEGGIWVTDDEDAYVSARRLTVFGEDLVRTEQRQYWSHGVGFNYRNHEMSAAFARSQLKRVDRYNAQAQRNARVLTEGLGDIDALALPVVRPGRDCSFWKYMVRVRPAALGWTGSSRELRDRVVQALGAEGVAAAVWQPQPIPAQPAFRRRLRTYHPRNEAEPLKPWDPAEFPVASRLLDLSFSLGDDARQLFVQSTDTMDRYVDAVHKVFANFDEVAAAPYERPAYKSDELVQATAID